MISFRVNAVPIAQPRQRHRVATINGRTMALNYTPKTAPVNAFKASVQLAAQQVYDDMPMTCPVRLRLVFVMPRPCSMIWKTKPMPRVHHTGRPDCDNICKAVKDALSKLVWRDDSQVCMVQLEKWTAAGDEQPHVEIEIEALES